MENYELYNWLKAFHIIFVVTWFAGLFYLPRLFVYHAMTSDRISLDRFKVMERKLFIGIMTPGGLLSTFSGLWLLVENKALLQLGSMQVKIGLILILWIYHIYCGKLLATFKKDKNTRSHVFYRWVNEIPTVILISVVILIVVKPF
jgi:putative membrane protein